MFLLFGIRPIVRDDRGGTAERRHCVRCGFISDLRPRTRRTWFTLFFVPVFPISKAEPFLGCTRCGAAYRLGYSPASPSEPGGSGASDQCVLVCPGCSEQVRVPVELGSPMRVTCPRCGDAFTVSVNRG